MLDAAPIYSSSSINSSTRDTRQQITVLTRAIRLKTQTVDGVGRASLECRNYLVRQVRMASTEKSSIPRRLAK
jgi:hypothetical protein